MLPGIEPEGGHSSPAYTIKNKFPKEFQQLVTLRYKQVSTYSILSMGRIQTGHNIKKTTTLIIACFTSTTELMRSQYMIKYILSNYE